MTAGTRPYTSEQEALGRALDTTQNAFRQASPDASVAAQAVTVGTSAAKLISASLTGRQYILIRPVTTTIYIGKDNTLTTSNGFLIAGDTTLALDLGPGVELWAISGSAGVNVRVLEVA